MKLVTIIDSKSIAARLGSSSLPSGTGNGRGYYRTPLINDNNQLKAYVIGLAIGDGNLSNPNGRAVRLRISCDTHYPNLISKITLALKTLFPENKVSLIPRKNSACVDVSCYSNHLEELLGWKASGGSKHSQNVRVPEWIKKDRDLMVKCLCGLFETDGSIYDDRGYIMLNFVTVIEDLAADVIELIKILGFKPRLYKIKQAPPHLDRYNIRISKDVSEFITLIGINKS